MSETEQRTICEIHDKSYFSTCDECGKTLMRGDKYHPFGDTSITRVQNR